MYLLLCIVFQYTTEGCEGIVRFFCKGGLVVLGRGNVDQNWIEGSVHYEPRFPSLEQGLGQQRWVECTFLDICLFLMVRFTYLMEQKCVKDRREHERAYVLLMLVWVLVFHVVVYNLQVGDQFSMNIPHYSIAVCVKASQVINYYSHLFVWNKHCVLYLSCFI